MGRIKTTLAKRVSNKLMAEKGEGFTSDFEKNKKLVEELADIKSKKIRNVIAGYITRLKKEKKKTPKKRRVIRDERRPATFKRRPQERR